MAKLSRKQRRLQRDRADAVAASSAPHGAAQGQPEKYGPFLRFLDANYRKLAIVPLVLFILALGVLVFTTVQTGSFLNKGITLTGGNTFLISDPSVDPLQLEQFLVGRFPDAQVTVRELTDLGRPMGVVIDASLDVPQADMLSALGERVSDIDGKLSIETTGSSLGESFFQQLLIALTVAFAFMAIVVFLYFRTFAPSVAIILAALSDIVVTIAVLDLVGFRFGTSGIAALLMLIGYSVDTDILLTTRVVKEKEGSVFDRVVGAMKTGMLMTVTSLVAVTAGFFLAESEVIRQIMLILLIGLLVDIINTWLQNVAIIRWYMERKGRSS
ncbi:MAG: protein translocase subunit SecF [Nanoarchaeota archaeon]